MLIHWRQFFQALRFSLEYILEIIPHSLNEIFLIVCHSHIVVHYSMSGNFFLTFKGCEIYMDIFASL